MKKNILAGILAVVFCSAANVIAQKSFARWEWVAPHGEEFAVMLPANPSQVRREVPFAGDAKLLSPAYEAETGGVRYTILSFEKSRQTPALASLETFTDGLRYAVLNSSGVNGNSLTYERDLSLKGHTGKQYQLKVSGVKGTARIYEATEHYYVLMTVGSAAGESDTDKFFNSFVLDDREASGDEDEFAISVVPPRPRVSLPPPLWSGSSSVSVPGMKNAPKSVIISGGVLDGKAISKPAPTYPAIAKPVRASGTVTVQIVVDEEGKVISASALGGHPLLQQAAVDAARQARFSPTRLSGQAVKVSGVVTYNFVFSNKADDTPSRKY